MAQKAYGALCTEYYNLDKPYAPADALNWYLAYAQRALPQGGRILEPMCGSGRFLLPLLARGYHIEGTDSSRDMLKSCREAARALKLHPTLYRVALQSMRLRKKYDLILIPAGSFGLITDELEIRSALENLHRHLLPAGVLLIEIETVRAQALPPKIWSSDWVTKVNGDKIILSTLPRFDEQTKILTLLQRYELWHRNQISRTEVEELRVRLYPFNEFTSYLEETGFYPINAYRPYTRNLPTSQSPSVLYECHKVN